MIWRYRLWCLTREME